MAPTPQVHNDPCHYLSLRRQASPTVPVRASTAGSARSLHPSNVVTAGAVPEAVRLAAAIGRDHPAWCHRGGAPSCGEPLSLLFEFPGDDACDDFYDVSLRWTPELLEQPNRLATARAEESQDRPAECEDVTSTSSTRASAPIRQLWRGDEGRRRGVSTAAFEASMKRRGGSVSVTWFPGSRTGCR